MSVINKISVKKAKTEYSNFEHLTIFIDDEPLDKILHKNYPDDNLLGLIPAYLDWIENEEERKVIWDRADLKEGEVKVAPILVCPDDLDLICTVVVAEVKATEDKIQWTRIGVDKTGNRVGKADRVGREVRWLDKIGRYTFNKIDYQENLNQFRDELTR